MPTKLNGGGGGRIDPTTLVHLMSINRFRIFSVCAPPYVMRPPVTEHVPLHRKSLCENMARASGW